MLYDKLLLLIFASLNYVVGFRISQSQVYCYIEVIVTAMCFSLRSTW